MENKKKLMTQLTAIIWRTTENYIENNGGIEN